MSVAIKLFTPSNEGNEEIIKDMRKAADNLEMVDMQIQTCFNQFAKALNKTVQEEYLSEIRICDRIIADTQRQLKKAVQNLEDARWSLFWKIGEEGAQDDRD